MHKAAVVLLAVVLVMVPARPAYGTAGLPSGAQSVGFSSISQPAQHRSSAPPVELKSVTRSTEREVVASRPERGSLTTRDPHSPLSTGYRSPIASVFLPAGVAAPFDPPQSRWGAGHRGVDVEAAVGDPVHAPAAGTVAFVGDVAGRGVVVIAHPDGLRSSMEPVGPEMSVGAHVERGDVVGSVERSESSHCAPEACLHWGVRRGDRYVDPLMLVYRPVIVLLPDP